MESENVQQNNNITFNGKTYKYMGIVHKREILNNNFYLPEGFEIIRSIRKIKAPKAPRAPAAPRAPRRARTPKIQLVFETDQLMDDIMADCMADDERLNMSNIVDNDTKEEIEIIEEKTEEIQQIEEVQQIENIEVVASVDTIEVIVEEPEQSITLDDNNNINYVDKLSRIHKKITNTLSNKLIFDKSAQCVHFELMREEINANRVDGKINKKLKHAIESEYTTKIRNAIKKFLGLSYELSYRLANDNSCRDQLIDCLKLFVHTRDLLYKSQSTGHIEVNNLIKYQLKHNDTHGSTPEKILKKIEEEQMLSIKGTIEPIPQQNNETVTSIKNVAPIETIIEELEQALPLVEVINEVVEDKQINIYTAIIEENKGFNEVIKDGVKYFVTNKSKKIEQDQLIKTIPVINNKNVEQAIPIIENIEHNEHNENIEYNEDSDYEEREAFSPMGQEHTVSHKPQEKFIIKNPKPLIFDESIFDDSDIDEEEDNDIRCAIPCDKNDFKYEDICEDDDDESKANKQVMHHVNNITKAIDDDLDKNCYFYSILECKESKYWASIFTTYALPILNEYPEIMNGDIRESIDEVYGKYIKLSKRFKSKRDMNTFKKILKVTNDKCIQKELDDFIEENKEYIEEPI